MEEGIVVLMFLKLLHNGYIYMYVFNIHVCVVFLVLDLQVDLPIMIATIITRLMVMVRTMAKLRCSVYVCNSKFGQLHEV